VEPAKPPIRADEHQPENSAGGGKKYLILNATRPVEGTRMPMQATYALGLAQGGLTKYPGEVSGKQHVGGNRQGESLFKKPPYV